MPPKPKADTAAQSALNIRLTAEDLSLLDRLVGAEAAEVTARFGADAGYIDVTRASLVRRWIRDGARAKGWLPALPVQTALPFVTPAPPVVPVVQEAAPAVPVAEQKHEAAVAAPPVVPVVQEAAPAVTVRAALVAAVTAGKQGVQAAIASEAGIDTSSLSKFKKGERPLPAEKLERLAAVLGKMEHAKR